MFKDAFGKVEVVGNQHPYVLDTNGLPIKIPIKSIRCLFLNKDSRDNEKELKIYS